MSGRITVRELPYDEYHKLATVPPFAAIVGGMRPSPSARIIVAETPDGQIVGHWTAFNAVHLEPLWIQAGQRTNAALNRGLLREMTKILDQDRVTLAYAIIADADADVMDPLAARVGFTKLPGALYVVERAGGSGEDT